MEEERGPERVDQERDKLDSGPVEETAVFTVRAALGQLVGLL